MKVVTEESENRDNGDPVLRAPLCDHLHDPVTQAARRRVAYRLTSADATSGGWRGWLRLPALGMAAALVLSVGALLYWSAERAQPATALLTQGGAPFVVLEGKVQTQHVTFQDGSRLTARDGARVVSLASTPRDFAVRLERGRLDVEVRPGGRHRWIIEAKLAQVEVVGTKFSVTRTATAVAVLVERGAVLVRSGHLAEGVQRLEAGQRLEVRAVETTSESAQRVGPKVEEESSLAGETVRLEPGASRPSENGASSTAAASPREEASSPGDFEKLRAQADAARAASQLDVAEALYARLVREHASDPRLALVLYNWGVASLQNGARQKALRTFQAVMNKSPSRSLQEDTFLRLVELQLELNLGAAAAESAQQYEARFPQGRHLSTIRALVERSAPLSRKHPAK